MNIIEDWNRRRVHNIKALAHDKAQADRLLGLHYTSDVATARKEHKKIERHVQKGNKRDIRDIIVHPVSYTHLTLPTICSV